MRYIKALLIICVFFVCMIFFFQNHAILSKTVTFQLNLLVMPAMTSIAIPFYFVMLGAFLLGALLCLGFLLFDRVKMQAGLARANMRMRSIESDQRRMLGRMKELSCAPEEEKSILASLKESFSFSFLGRGRKEKAEAAEEKKPENGKDAYINEFFRESTPDEIEADQATLPTEKSSEKTPADKASAEKDTQKSA